ncbi:hypothetical protein ES703_102201 [subsurface metagenome]
MTVDNRNGLGKILKVQRVMIPLTLQELAAKSGVSTSYLSRIERGERCPSARILRKIAKPLGFGEEQLFSFAGYLSPEASTEVEPPSGKRLDPYVDAVLSQEPVDVQRTVIAILSIFKSIAKGSDCRIEFAEYIHRNYPEVDDDTITMIKDILEHPPKEVRDEVIERFSRPKI